MKKAILLGIGLLIIPLFQQGCSMDGFRSGSNSSATTTLAASSALGKVSLSVLDNTTGDVIFSDDNASTALKLKAGTNYTVQVDAPSAPASTVFKIVSTRINTIAVASTTIPLVVGANVVTVATAGDYSWKLTATAPKISPLTLSYMADVTCASPTFTADSLNPAGISASAGGSNLYNFSVGGVVGGANGLAPYTCALDPTGVGILDTTFVPCANGFNNVYVNYVGTRNVGVIVKDACNTTYAVSNPVNLPYTVPALGGAFVFISGITSGATGMAIDDPRADGVEYLATNSGGNNIVLPKYGGGSFTIGAAQSYGQPSSVKFGVKINLRGITDTINLTTGTGTIDASAATISSVIYSTDQAGDASPAVAFSGSNCVLSQQGGSVLFVTGTPCAGGTTVAPYMATVKVWGHYQCTALTSAGGTINIEGDFNGFEDIADSCVGGGGGGGGGIVPIDF